MNIVYFYSPSFCGMREEITFFDQLNASLYFNRRLFNKIIIYSTVSVPKYIEEKVDKVIILSVSSLESTHLNRVISWKEYSKSDDFDQDTIYADADIIFNNNFKEIINNNIFSLCFLASPSPKSFSCINAGIILLKHSNKDDIFLIFNKILKIAKKIKNIADPRFPSIGKSAIWGLDEMCLFNFFNDLIEKKNLPLRNYIESLNLNFPDIIKIDDKVSLMHLNYSIPSNKLININDYKNYPSVHFSGVKGKELLLKLFISSKK